MFKSVFAAALILGTPLAAVAQINTSTGSTAGFSFIIDVFECIKETSKSEQS